MNSPIKNHPHHPRDPVFLVDDDESFRKSTARLLRLSGFTIVEFATAGEFLIAFSHDMKGCLVLDICMPGPDGMELLHHLKRRDVCLPVIFLTGHGDVPTAVEAMRRGAFDFLTKPVEKESLIEAVEKALSQNSDDRVEASDAGRLKERFQTLTPSEKDVYRMVVDGLPNKAIAGEMGNAERTVKLHRSNLSRKMGAQCVADLVRFYCEADLS